MTDMTATDTANPVFGWIGFFLAAMALFAALFVFWAGPFAPQQSTGVSLGELAAELGKSTLRAAAGLEQPAPVAQTRDLDDYLQIGVAMLGGLAIVVSVIGILRHERMRPAIAGVAVGIGAILFQFFAFAFFAFLGVLVIMALLNSFSDVFSGLFGG
ncbi:MULTISPECIES: hypothetical protein [unclassified Ruegeria]|uniref:hypothetical protein n=1 Tax=unclassified Ruegeria TaxID=2625375 RepID=UPI001489E213|nr:MULTISPECIES: hypothetical protein [unclassified Ruegeria]NOD33215.1 hypothetical protein [Ruegeria sp. HKCCD7296]NOD48742.1 hypothetical protein [Ruegeria sp. HKCCD5849]NOD51955.1 hypothetical protein [Ruegeria sp. HKCCD5851]NOD66613.1 hypothetical protein [Ruegeria sp. HKCCD7303]NOE33901.1 hypothetical protein [Ruegeria sp. HKCCD7318]